MNYSQELSQLVDWFNQLSVSALVGLILTLSGFGLLLLTARRPGKTSKIPMPKVDKTKPVKASGSLFSLSSRKRKADKRDEFAEMQRQIAWQNNAINLLGERVLALEAYLEMVGSRQQVFDIQKRDQQFYRDAIQLVDQGLSSQELAEKCGIPASEAELLSILYRKAS